MASAENGNKVRVHYTGTLEDGSVFDTSKSRGPLEFVIGQGRVIKGFDRAVKGLSPGEKIKVKIPMADAYGPRKPELLITMNRSDYPVNLTPKVGRLLHVVNDQGKGTVARVIEVEEDRVILDGNHPMAGKDLNFEIELLEILPE